MKCKVFIDTNNLFNDKGGQLDTPFNNCIIELEKFLKDHKVTNVAICLPEIVIRERIQHKLEHIKISINKANENITLLKTIGHKTKEIKPRKNYKKILENNVSEFIKKHKVERIPVPNINSSTLLDRAIEKKKPFDDKTAGFKDTLIYFSLLNDALKNRSETYILCTNNHKDFDESVQSEFEKTTGKKLYILPDTFSAQQKLDEILPLNLHLEERDNTIKDLILKNTGLLVAEANKNTTNNNNHFGIYSNSIIATSFNPVLGGAGTQEIIGYSFNNITFLGIEELRKNVFTVNVKLKVDINYKNNTPIAGGWGGSADFIPYMSSPYDSVLAGGTGGYQERQKDFEIMVICDLEHKIINPANIKPAYGFMF